MHWGETFSHTGSILHGFALTIALVALTTVACLVTGTALTIMRVLPLPSLRIASKTIVDVLNNTPNTLIFTAIVFGLPSLGIHWSFFIMALVSLIVSECAYFAEAIRSGFNAIDRGQVEAGISLGFRYRTLFYRVIIRQAFEHAIRPLTTAVIKTIKGSALAEAFGVAEATYQLDGLVSVHPQIVYSLFILIGGGYIILAFGVSGMAAVLVKTVGRRT